LGVVEFFEEGGLKQLSALITRSKGTGGGRREE
jgi:hypothetical protein